VVLASADLDHVLGLLLLRELQPLRIYTTPSIRRILREDNSLFGMLNRVSDQAQWVDIQPENSFSLLTVGGKDSGLRCEALSLSTRYPAYVTSKRTEELVPEEALLGLIVECTGRKVGYFSAVPQVEDDLLAKLEDLDLLFFEGTFWSDDELIRVQGSCQTARQMGHIPVSSLQGSLHKLAGLRRPRKIFLHVNNTNPMLDEASPEFRQVLEAGWEVAEDGSQFEL
jgi:pyrroloquinoline quinone biosynthesis protein B